ncbi:MAG: MarC family NAAT transporter [bacterium]|nr:MarC family NAAT transporter [bacterium]
MQAGNIADIVTWAGIGLVSLLPIVNPFSAAILLLSAGSHLSQSEQHQQILQACTYMAAILIAFLMLGHFIMVAFGISVPGIRIAGGMVIGFIGFRKLFQHEAATERPLKRVTAAKPDISFSPLAMPSLSGPAAIAVAITMSSAIDGNGEPGKLLAFTGVILAIVITALISWLVLRSARLLQRILGKKGVDNLSKLLGFILVCIGIQFIINGIRDLLQDRAFWHGQDSSLTNWLRIGVEYV